MQSALAIKHAPGSVPPAFELTRLSDGKSLPPVHIPSPYEAPVPGHPYSLMRELRWYLEKFLEYPFPPETDHAEDILDALKLWGTQAFNALFDRRDAGDWLSASDILQLRSDDANVLSWPWEALFDPQRGSFTAHQHRFERRLNRLADPPPLKELPNARINILLVVARPYEDDVRYRSIARPLVELIQSHDLPAQVTVLRPPTFDSLREHLRAYPGRYHVLHFDGHGAFGDDAAGDYSPHRYRAPQGCLVFEDSLGGPDPKSAADLSTLLHEHAVPAVVLNACQSAALDETSDNPFATVATALLQSGMRSVVAMAYSLYVSGAQVFLPAFYRRLFESGQVAEAVRAGRQQMLSNKNRISPRGPYPLNDWLLPVLYQQSPLDLAFAASAQREDRPSRLHEDVLQHNEPYGFIGRDGPILEMERALHRQAPCILLHGLGGVGKTTLARGFLRWLDETGGLDAGLWFDFRDIHSSEYVLNRIGEKFYGEKFSIAPNKLALLAQAFRRNRVIVVWDNFESAAENLLPADRSELTRFLEAVHGTRGKVIVTSRSREDWLDPSLRFELPLRGLDGEERWEYCDVILRELNLLSKIDREAPELVNLMDQLAGHPLAMRVVLPKLERMPAARIAAALRTNIAELGLSEKEGQGRLFATLRFVAQGLAEDLQPLLPLVGLHEAFLDADYLEDMAKRVDPAWTRPQIDHLMAALTGAGLLKGLGQDIYEMHPLLTSYLRSQTPVPSESSERAFVDVMAQLSNALAPKQLHEQRVPFLLHGLNFRSALTLSGRLSMDSHFAALTQSLALHAQHLRNFSEASRLFGELARHAEARQDWSFQSSAYHQLGMIAQQQRDFETSREWYLKSLTISEKQEDLHTVASTYHQLGIIAHQQLEFDTAREWYLKSLVISEQHGSLHSAAGTYHQLGGIAQAQRDFTTAREWYLKSLAIEEKQDNLEGASITYHELGRVAEAKQEFATARDWYLRSLDISEKQGNLYGATLTYYQLGMIAQAQRDFATARHWYLKSLAISEKQGNLYNSAHTYGQLGNLDGKQNDVISCAGWLTKSIRVLRQAADEYTAELIVQNFFIAYRQASPEDQLRMQSAWTEAGLGPFPTEPAS